MGQYWKLVSYYWLLRLIKQRQESKFGILSACTVEITDAISTGEGHTFESKTRTEKTRHCMLREHVKFGHSQVKARDNSLHKS